MRSRNVLFERRLKRPLDDGLREAIDREAAERFREVHLPAKFSWEEEDRVFAVKMPLASFFATFSPETMVVSAELSLAARLLATKQNRQRAVEIIQSMADRLDL